jgi:chromatin assembly factor 1 subunit B
LTYKSIFAVLTEKSILIYDTYHTKPIAMARGLHYSGLTDAMWSPNGHSLVVSSSDGYLSFLTFGEGELGKVYTKKVVVEEIKVVVEEIKVVVGEAVATTTVESSADSASSHPIPPPKEQTINVLQPKKKSDKKRAELQQVTHVLQPKKKNRDSTTEKKLVAQPTTGNSTTSKHSNVLQREKKNGDTDSSTEKKLVAQPTTDSITVQKGVEPQKINILQPKKKRKRAELTLVPAGTQ